jgi:hypothetical protein
MRIGARTGLSRNTRLHLGLDVRTRLLNGLRFRVDFFAIVID